jgi:uncharacterized MAPEG superfamily protein
VNVSYACVLAAYAALFVPKLPLAHAQSRESGGYDNNHPRIQQDKLMGFGSRALAAHLNGLESFPLFAAAVIMANAAHADVAMVNRLAIAHVVLRVLYSFLYMANIAVARSAVWGLATSASLWLMVLATVAQ